MFEVGVVVEFEALHHLVGDFGPASQPHGHTYRVEASVAGAALQEDGTLLDITLLQQALARVVDDLQQRDLNTLPGMEPNTTAEIVARYIWRGVAPALPPATLSVRVWESAVAYASYSAATSRA